MTPDPLLSIVIPSYNYARYLGDCLTSIFAQQGAPPFGDSGILIHLFSTGITLNGAGNTAAGATFGDNLCDSVFTWNGTVVFDGVPITEANCP